MSLIALASGAVSALGGLLGNYLGNKQMQAYNTPAAQMQRYRDAGLNPYLVQADAGNMSTAPDYGSSIQHGVDKYMQQLQITQAQANVEYTRAMTQNLRSEMDARNKISPLVDGTYLYPFVPGGEYNGYDLEAYLRRQKSFNEGVVSQNRANKLAYEVNVMAPERVSQIKQQVLQSEEQVRFLASSILRIDKDVEVKNYLLNNLYPEQVSHYKELVNQLKIENSYEGIKGSFTNTAPRLLVLLWNFISKYLNSDAE